MGRMAKNHWNWRCPIFRQTHMTSKWTVQVQSSKILKSDHMYTVWHGYQQCATFQDQTAMVPKLQGFCPNYQPPSHGVNIYLGFLCKTWYCSHLSSWPGTSFKNSWIIQARQCGKPNNKPPNWGVLNHNHWGWPHFPWQGTRVHKAGENKGGPFIITARTGSSIGWFQCVFTNSNLSNGGN
jgi:hypothetical protein